MKLSSTASAINREVLRLALPSILAGITIPLVGMADTAIAGRLGSAAHIGAIALGSTMFDWLYWNMSFLRMGTAGISAQAYGRGDFRKAVSTFMQGMLVALSIALVILLFQRPYARLFFLISPTSAEIQSLALTYFYIRVWAAPAALSLFTVRGWFFGMQNSIGPMLIDIIVNVVNIAASFLFALQMDMGVAGIALGTVLAQYTGLLSGLFLLWLYFRKYRSWLDWKDILVKEDLKRFFSINANLFLRSICMLLIYSGFTMLASRLGDMPLAVSSIMMKLLLLYSYFIDGFAYAGEALTGRYIGEKNEGAFKLCIRILFAWCLIIGILSTIAYFVGDEWLLGIMTSVESVKAACRPYLPWLYVMPFISCIAFTWDGIYIGATASRAIRNGMFFAVAAFYLSYFLLKPWLGFQALWIAYAAHLVARSLAMTLYAPRHIYSRV